MKPTRWFEMPEPFAQQPDLHLHPCKRSDFKELDWTADAIPTQFTLSGGQTYLLTGNEQVETARGTTVLILHWSTHCPSCGTAFVCKTGVTLGGKGPVRRCKRCRRPGWSVKNELASR